MQVERDLRSCQELEPRMAGNEEVSWDMLYSITS